MNTPRLTGLLVFASLAFGVEWSKCLPENVANGAKYYVSGIVLPLTETTEMIFSARYLPGGTKDSYVIGLLMPRSNDDASGGVANEAGQTAFWILLVFALLALAGYLLFQIRRKQAAHARIHLLEKDVSVLFDYAPCGYHSVDKEGTIINVNNTLLRWLGYERDEVLHKLKFSDLVVGDPGEIAEKIESISRLRSRKTDVTLTKKDGEHLPVILRQVSTDGLTSSRGERLFSTINDKRCHEALERIKTLDQELEAFSYSISHDLRAPLRSIDGYSRILQEDYAQELDDEGKRVLGVVMNNARRMGKLIDDLLDFGRLGRKAIHYSKLNMSGIVHSILAELKAQEPTRDIRVEVDELLPALGDADMLRQVWYNLLENAIKYTGKTALAHIEVRSYVTEQNELCYEVRDNGVGFDMLYADKLFGIFQRLHKMQDFSGTGVGLAIVKRIITRHGGRVWANGSLNDGATFNFTLPPENENK